jgi:hypothetical protein
VPAKEWLVVLVVHVTVAFARDERGPASWCSHMPVRKPFVGAATVTLPRPLACATSFVIAGGEAASPEPARAPAATSETTVA